MLKLILILFVFFKVTTTHGQDSISSPKGIDNLEGLSEMYLFFSSYKDPTIKDFRTYFYNLEKTARSEIINIVSEMNDHHLDEKKTGLVMNEEVDFSPFTKGRFYNLLLVIDSIKERNLDQDEVLKKIKNRSSITLDHDNTIGGAAIHISEDYYGFGSKWLNLLKANKEEIKKHIVKKRKIPIIESIPRLTASCLKEPKMPILDISDYIKIVNKLPIKKQEPAKTKLLSNSCLSSQSERDSESEFLYIGSSLDLNNKMIDYRAINSSFTIVDTSKEKIRRKTVKIEYKSRLDKIKAYVGLKDYYKTVEEKVKPPATAFAVKNAKAWPESAGLFPVPTRFLSSNPEASLRGNFSKVLELQRCFCVKEKNKEKIMLELFLIADDAASVSINGIHLTDHTDHITKSGRYTKWEKFQEAKKVVDITNKVKAGKNCINFRVIDDQSVAFGMFFHGYVYVNSQKNLKDKHELKLRID